MKAPFHGDARGGQPQEGAQRGHALGRLHAVRASRAHHQSVREVHVHGGPDGAGGHATCSRRSREGTNETAGAGQLEAGIERLVTSSPRFEFTVGGDQGRDARSHSIEVGGDLSARPELVPAGHQHTRPAEGRVAPDAAHRLEAGAFDRTCVEHDDGGIEDARALEPVGAEVGNGDERAALSKRLGETIGPRWVVFHDQHAQTLEDLGVRRPLLRSVIELQATPRRLEELVA